MTLELYPFQQEGVNFLLKHPQDPAFPVEVDGNAAGQFHKLLADDMGLGKTIQVIGALNQMDAKNAVIVCPASVKIHWARKIAQFAKRNYKLQIIESGKDTIGPYTDIVITGYELLMKKKIREQVKARGQTEGFDVGVIDEAHYLKNVNAQRTKLILGSKDSFLHETRYKWALTGTPVLNRPFELYPILATFAPECIFPHITVRAFGDRFCSGRIDRRCERCGCFILTGHVSCYQCGSTNISDLGYNVRGASNLDELARRLKGFMLRRCKEDVLDELPDKVETVIEMPEVIPSVTTDTEYLPTVRRQLSYDKAPGVAQFIENMLVETGKVVVFSHHRATIEYLKNLLLAHDPVICYGGMKSDEKQLSIDTFVNRETTRIFIGQTQAGGVGIDGLQGVCNTCIFLEPDWSPGNMDQAIDRLRRIGQKNTVFVYYFYVPDSTDDLIYEVVNEKRKIVESLIKSSEVKETMTIESQLQETNELLRELIKVCGGSAPKAAAPAAKPAAKKPTGSAKKPATKKPEPAAKSGPSVDDVRSTVGNFISGASDADAARNFINEKVWPRFDVKNLNELLKLPEHFGAVISELAGGFDAIAGNDEVEGDVDLGV